MNAYQEFQTSGNQWPPPVQAMLHREFQPSSPFPKPKPRPRVSIEDLEKQMPAFATEHGPALKQVWRDFVLPPDSSVVTFLSEHRTILPILLESGSQLRACFGKETVFTLRAPIDESGSQTLYAVAMWRGNVRDVREALAKFDDTWWIEHSRQASGYLVFTYELV